MFSNYKFENAYLKYKKAVKSGRNVLSQVINFECLRREIFKFIKEKKNYYDDSDILTSFPDNYFLNDNSILTLKDINDKFIFSGTFCTKTYSLYKNYKYLNILYKVLKKKFNQKKSNLPKSSGLRTW